MLDYWKGTFLQVVADINNVQVISVPLTEEFHLPVDEVYIYICSLVLTSVYMMVIRNSHFFTLRLKKWEVTYLKYFVVVIVLSSFFIFQVLVSFLLLPLIVPIQINEINYDTITGWTLLVEKFQRKKINPLTPMRDQNTISPSSLNTISGRQVMRIKKNIN